MFWAFPLVYQRFLDALGSMSCKSGLQASGGGLIP